MMSLYKKWYEHNFVIILALIFVLPVGLYLMLKHSEWSKTAKGTILGGLTGLLIFSFFILITKYMPPRYYVAPVTSKNTLTDLNTLGAQVVTTDNSANYELLGSNSLSNVENYYYLYKGDDVSVNKMQEVSIELRAKNCKKACNISIYDDKRAYEIDMDYFKLTDPSEQEQWKKDNYVYVANHLLEWVPAGKVNDFMYYPYKDAYYQELLSKTKDVPSVRN